MEGIKAAIKPIAHSTNNILKNIGVIPTFRMIITTDMIKDITAAIVIPKNKGSCFLCNFIYFSFYCLYFFYKNLKHLFNSLYIVLYRMFHKNDRTKGTVFLTLPLNPKEKRHNSLLHFTVHQPINTAHKTANTMVGSIFATLIFLPQIKLTPTQNISIDPVMDK